MPYDELLTTTTKVGNGEPDNKDDDGNSTKRKEKTNQRDHKEQRHRDGTNTRKRPRFLLSQ